ncbi:hypothetical protein [Thermasporomyces composti]|uniref:Uncharacterized protein n=1 Tax=Thermasporomyces composti TaxID=696763 RepID=A0A3D9UZL3_THECX|nr:hypothetical protein [Thermasporomyces composti]REF34717.1 hypothetical protein DFJ64_0081 [Thermasporomyces composti]
MIDRFAVRKSSQGFGVWDAAVNGWHSRQDLSEAEATALARSMNAGHTPREARTGSRRVSPAKPVLVLVDGRWWPGRLDWWVRETDGWYGRVTLDDTGARSWYPAATLRPANPARSS